jgi:nucleoside 2-deoxyribosyltransferase
MRVYIAGPMTGYPYYNEVTFKRAEAEWREAGHDAVTPFEANSAVWQKHYGRSFDPRSDKCDYGDPLLREMLAADIALLASVEIVAVLPGWRKSRGVAVELTFAKAMGIPVYDAITRAPLPEETALEEAQRLVHGDRGAAYGHPIDDYTRTGRMWGAILGMPDIDPRICCLMMSAVKISREVNAPKRDNRVDLAGYAECAEMVAQRQAERP